MIKRILLWKYRCGFALQKSRFYIPKVPLLLDETYCFALRKRHFCKLTA
ncbi:hypothetical protein PI172_0462 [Prevotella intermedia]|uniref:Uncharacterized protein n=1 Tax=Prevotella intermedia TaxID=28131 RepID=A0AAD1BIW5_PREIN|nr:hypothetical protein PI172_0462 [Prevotella intermedia]